MLLYRIITAAILIPLVVCGILFLDAKQGYGVTLVLAGWSAWEWTAVVPFAKRWMRYLYVLCLLAIYIAMFWLPVILILILSAVFWLLAFINVCIYPKHHPRWAQSTPVLSIIGVMAILPCWYSVNVLLSFEHGHFLLLYLLVVVWIADIGAYFIGKHCGKRKLAPEVSPNKTIEGALGGVLVCALISALTAWLFHSSVSIGAVFVAVSVFTVLVSIVGDLFVSVQKRVADIKDMGNILPGHGGLVDRVDSMMAAAPIFTLLMILISIVWAM